MFKKEDWEQHFNCLIDRRHQLGKDYQFSEESIENIQSEQEEEEEEEEVLVKEENTPSVIEKVHGRKIEIVPSTWFKKCPLEKITHNIKLINEFQKQDKFPSIFNINESKPLQFANQKEEELFNNRAKIAKFLILKQQKKVKFIKYLNRHPSHIEQQQDREPEYPFNFKTTAETVLNQTLHTLEDFIIDHFKINIIKLNRIEYRQIMTMLFNCSHYFDTDVCETLFQFIRIAFRIGEITIYKVTQVTRCYKALQIATKIKTSQKLESISKIKGEEQLKTFRQLTVKTHLKQIWNYDFEKLLLATYLKDQNFGHIKSVFQFTYHQHAGVFTSNELKDRFYSIIRLALKMIRSRIKQQKGGLIPKMLGLNEKRFKILGKSKTALNIRLWLVDIYMREDCSEQQIQSIVLVMNEFISSKQNSSQMTSEISSKVNEGSELDQSEEARSKEVESIASKNYNEDIYCYDSEDKNNLVKNQSFLQKISQQKDVIKSKNL